MNEKYELLDSMIVNYGKNGKDNLGTWELVEFNDKKKENSEPYGIVFKDMNDIIEAEAAYPQHKKDKMQELFKRLPEKISSDDIKNILLGMDSQ